MNTRSCLLTVGVSALLATGSVITAAPASAAPGSAECVSAQSALKAQIGVASVDINLANQLRAAMADLELIGAQLDPLYVEAELATQDELATFDAAMIAEADARDRLEAAEIALAALEAADPQDPVAVAAADQEQQDAAAALPLAEAARVTADAAYTSALEAAFSTPAIVTLEEQFEVAVASFDDAFTRLGLTEGSDPEQLIALADAAVAACSAPAVANMPAVTVSAPQQRGLNIQTAAHDAGATDPANLALLAGLAGFGAAASAGAVVVRRRSAGQA